MLSRPSTTALRRPLRMPLLALAAALSASLVTSCSGGPSPGSAPPAATAASPPSAGDAGPLHDAQQLLLRDCMRRHGFAYTVFPLDEESAAVRFPYVVDDADWARRHGYGGDLARRAARLAAEDPNRAYFASLPPDRRARALVVSNGPSPQGLSVRLPGGGELRRSDRGCVAEAERDLYGDHGAWFRASARVDALDRIRRGRVAAEPTYGAGLRAWSRCMRKAGHSYTTPVAARAAATGPKHPLPRDREVALALAEAACAASSGLGATARRLDARHGAALRAEYRADVDTRDRLRARALTRARQILRAHGAP
ncbi:hypothetical protein ACFU9F_19130 [Streptomyces zhihengii]|uniref:hypothetical protein n=1 Tax=Streptomyces zhihengii TaxID=1818004 RepID=UPI0036BF2B7B